MYTPWFDYRNTGKTIFLFVLELIEETAVYDDEPCTGLDLTNLGHNLSRDQESDAYRTALAKHPNILCLLKYIVLWINPLIAFS